MWTAKQGAAIATGYMVTASFTLTNDATGEVIEDKTFADDLTADRLAAVVEARIKSLETRDTAVQALKKSEGTAIVLPRDKVLTPDEQAAKGAAIAADAFFGKLADLNALRLQLDKKLIQPDDTALAQATVAVKAGYLPEYAKDIRYR